MVVRAKLHLDHLLFALHRERGPSGRVAFEIAEEIIEIVILQGDRLWVREEILDRRLLTGRNLRRGEQPVRCGADVDGPLFARRVGQFEVGVKANSHRHRVGTEVDDFRAHLKYAIFQPLRQLHRVSERELRHPIRVPVEIQATGYPGSLAVRLYLHHLPVWVLR